MSKRVWNKAKTFDDLCELTAQWLSGDLSTHPGTGYTRCGPDPETRELVPDLVHANRSGFLTEMSQPGLISKDPQGRLWSQRAAVCGFVRDEQLVLDLIRRASRARVFVWTASISGPGPGAPRRGINITVVDGEASCGFYPHVSSRDLDMQWPGIPVSAFRELKAAHQVFLVDRAWGRNNVLWDLL